MAPLLPLDLDLKKNFLKARLLMRLNTISTYFLNKTSLTVLLIFLLKIGSKMSLKQYYRMCLNESHFQISDSMFLSVLEKSNFFKSKQIVLF